MAKKEKSPKGTEEVSFEESLQKLETIVQKLEAGELDLEKSLKEFEEGVQLYQFCKGKLEKAEKKIKVLTEGLKEEDLSSS